MKIHYNTSHEAIEDYPNDTIYYHPTTGTTIRLDENGNGYLLMKNVNPTYVMWVCMEVRLTSD